MVLLALYFIPWTLTSPLSFFSVFPISWESSNVCLSTLQPGLWLWVHNSTMSATVIIQNEVGQMYRKYAAMTTCQWADRQVLKLVMDTRVTEGWLSIAEFIRRLYYFLFLTFMQFRPSIGGNYTWRETRWFFVCVYVYTVFLSLELLCTAV